MSAFLAEESELLARDISNVVRVNSSTHYHDEKLFYDDYYLKVFVCYQEHLIQHDYGLKNLVPYLEQRYKVGHMDFALLVGFLIWEHAYSSLPLEW